MNTYGGLAQLGEHLVYTQVVGGSIPSSSITSGRSAAGSASGLGPEGRRFKSCHPDLKGLLDFGKSFFCFKLNFFLNKKLPGIFHIKKVSDSQIFQKKILFFYINA